MMHNPIKEYIELVAVGLLVGLSTLALSGITISKSYRKNNKPLPYPFNAIISLENQKPPSPQSLKRQKKMIDDHNNLLKEKNREQIQKLKDQMRLLKQRTRDNQK